MKIFLAGLVLGMLSVSSFAQSCNRNRPDDGNYVEHWEFCDDDISRRKVPAFADFPAESAQDFKPVLPKKIDGADTDDNAAWLKRIEETYKSGKGTMPTNIKDSIRNVRANHMAKSFPGQQMLYRDFIGDDDGAFGVLSRPNTCIFVVDAATTRTTFKHEDFAPGQPCSTFVASARFDKGATAYYIGLFDGPQKKRQLALFSVSHNVIKAEKDLAAQAASKGQLGDIKSVRQFLTTAAKP